MKKRILLAAVFVLLVVIVGGLFVTVNSQIESKYVVLAEEDTQITLLATGRIVGIQYADLSFARSGNLAEVLVKEGDFVEAGQVLAELSKKEARLFVRQRETELSRAELDLKSVQGPELEQAREAYNQSRLELKKAKNDYERNLELYRIEVVSPAEFEVVENQYLQAKSRSLQAESVVKELRGARVEHALLGLEHAQINLEEAKLLYDETALKAPQAGIILELTKTTGEYIQTGQTIMVFIPDADKTFVEVEVDEDYIGHIVSGQKAFVTSSAIQNKIFPAEVVHVSPGIDASRGTFRVRLSLNNKVEELPPDAGVFAEIITGDYENALFIAQKYIREEREVFYVYVEEEGRAIRYDLEGEFVGNNLFIITDGIETGARVLISTDISEGSRVRLGGEASN